MNELSNLWAWATEAANQRGIHTIDLIAGLVAMPIVAIWGLIKFFSSRRGSKANPTEVTAAKRGIAAGQNVTIHFGITPEQFLKGLNQREEEVRKELAELKTSEIEKRRILERTLDSVYEQMTNLQKALEAKEAKLNEAYQALNNLKGVSVPVQLDIAKTALKKEKN